jgi:hypothetical protein
VKKVLDLTCPFCRRANDRATGFAEGAIPTPGDTLVCFKCLRPAVVTDENNLRVPTQEEIQEILKNPEFIALVRSFSPEFTPREWRRAAKAASS